MIKFLRVMMLTKIQKKDIRQANILFLIFYIKTNTYASATTFFTETKERFSLPLRKVTTPSTNAYNV